MEGFGYLAIWSDLAPEDETDWTHWITREHGRRTRRDRGIFGLPHFSRVGHGGQPLFHTL